MYQQAHGSVCQPLYSSGPSILKTPGFDWDAFSVPTITPTPPLQSYQFWKESPSSFVSSSAEHWRCSRTSKSQPSPIWTILEDWVKIIQMVWINILTWSHTNMSFSLLIIYHPSRDRKESLEEIKQNIISGFLWVVDNGWLLFSYLSFSIFSKCPSISIY